MFEQSILVAHNTNKTWTLAASLAVQASLIAVGIMIPLVYRDSIPGLAKWMTGVIAPPPAPPPEAPPVQTQASVQRAAPESSTIFRPPAQIPNHVDMRPDVMLAPAENYQPTVIGGVGVPTESTNVLAQMLRQPVVKPRPPDPPPAVTPVQKSAPMHVSKGVQEAKIINKVIPVYPKMAIATRVQGTVHLVGIIGRDGSIRELRVLDGNFLLVPAAVEAVRQWTYKPTLLSGEPMEVIAPIEVIFTLNR